MQATASRTKTYRKGPIFREGDKGDAMFVIRTGKVKISKNMYGIMVKIAELGPGDHFGEMALIEGVPRSASAIAETTVEADVYDRAALVELIAADPEFAFAMLRGMSRRLRAIDERLTDLVAKGRMPQEEASKFGAHTAY
jgi:CRP/FNR family transcriptional regulator/CRP/FNR family cyclic AMP-dependent transcriptional regulator